MSSCHPLSSIFWTAHGSSFNKSLQTTDMVSKGGLEFTWQYVQIIFNVSIGDTWIYILRMDPCLWYFEQCFIVRWNMFPPFLLLLISALAAEAADTLKGDQHYQHHRDHNDHFRRGEVYEPRGLSGYQQRMFLWRGARNTSKRIWGEYRHDSLHKYGNPQEFEVSRPNLRMGKCVCKPGFVQLGTNFACHRESKLQSKFNWGNTRVLLWSDMICHSFWYGCCFYVDPSV